VHFEEFMFGKITFRQIIDVSCANVFSVHVNFYMVIISKKFKLGVH